jgi:hypothetical protein
VPAPPPAPDTPEGAPEPGTPSPPPSAPSGEAPPIVDVAWEELTVFDQGVSRSVTASAPRFDAAGHLWIAEARPAQTNESLMLVLRWDGKEWQYEDGVSTDGMSSQDFSLALDAQGRMLVGWTEMPLRGSDPVLLWRQGAGLMPSLQAWEPEYSPSASAGVVLSNARGETVYVWKHREADGVHRTLRSLRIQGDAYVPFAPPLPLPEVLPREDMFMHGQGSFALEDDGGLVAAVFDSREPAGQGLHLWRWRGESWTELPALPPLTGEAVAGFRIAAEAGTLVVSRTRDNAGRFAVDVFRWKEGAWEALPYEASMEWPYQSQTPVRISAAVTVDAQQRVWLAHPRPEAEHNDTVVRVWTGSRWEPVGEPLRGYRKPMPQYPAGNVELRVQGTRAAVSWSEPAQSGAWTVFVATLRAKP